MTQREAEQNVSDAVWTDSDLRPLRTFFPRGLRSATLRASGPALCSHSARALLGFYPCHACVMLAWCSLVARGSEFIWLSS